MHQLTLFSTEKHTNLTVFFLKLNFNLSLETERTKLNFVSALRTRVLI